MSSVYSSYIKRMRMCANENCKGCTYAYEGLTNTEDCKEDLLYDAAEQLEDADKCNARLVKKCKEMEKRIAEMEKNFSDVCNANGSLACERNELLNYVRKLEAQLPKEGEWLDEQRGMKEILQSVPSAWISVKDRLPEESGSYLVCDVPYKIMSVVAYSARWKRFNCYDTFDEEHVNGQGEYAVTHWMPLPDAPEVEG